MPDPSAGEVGGWLGWLLAAVTTLGGAIAWLAGRDDKRKSIREEKLKAWQQELEARERQVDEKQAEYYAALEQKLKLVLEQNAALVGAYQLIVAALRTENPGNPALGRADELLKAVFPIDTIIPPNMVALLKQMPGDHLPEPKAE